MRMYDLIFAKRWPVVRVDSSPYLFASFVGASVSLVSTACAVVVTSAMVLLLPKEILGASAAAILSGQAAPAIFVLAVLVVPLWETLIAQLLPLELARGAGIRDVGSVIIGGIIFGVGHYLNGGLLHGIGALFGGALFALSYITLRPWGYLPAFSASWIAHALHNALMLYVVPAI